MMPDHCFTDCMVTVTGTEPMKPTTIKTRKLKAIDMSAFKSDIANITLKSTDLQGMVMEYNTHLQELLNTHAPEVEKTVHREKCSHGSVIRSGMNYRYEELKRGNG